MKPHPMAAVLPGMFETPTTATPHAVTLEKRRLNAAAIRVLIALQGAGEAGLTNVQLSVPAIGGLRAVGRIDELREHYAIEKQHVSGGTWRYIYRGYR